MDTLMAWETVSTKQRRIADIARHCKGEPILSLGHYIDLEWMYCAYEMTRRDGAVGVDGVTAEEFERDLEGNLRKLIDQLKSGRYRAPEVRRVYIPKAGSNEKRPLGIPTYGDKILQRAVQMALEPVYEQEFHDCSYGFRPGKSAHQAVDRIWKESMNIGGGYIIDMDISTYFDTIPHDKLREVLEQRISDGVIRRIIGKWLNAGTLEEGSVHYPEAGTPQGGVISPLLSNSYLHEVLDRWFEQTVKPCLKGKAFMVRYADDAIIGCESKADADRIMKVLPLRFAKYGLTIHPEKTKLVDFRAPTGDQRKGNGSFTFPGFRHYWMKSRKGRWIIGRKTDNKRLTRALQRITQWCRQFRHLSRKEQHGKLSAKLRGHYGYYGIWLNFRSMALFYQAVQRIWFKWLNRRSDRTSRTWDQYVAYLKAYPLPAPRIVHSYS